ncbi:MAG: type I-E CRISPR-associated protein Cse2/CasB [Chthonomonadales bacterium]|nr:type I-E CRISPR-associated protein Cse2/CasB [Chthonomonadales bacterium]
MSTAAEQFIDALTGLKAGDLGRLRALAGQPLDASVDAFDLFAGLWWPLRQRSARAPRRTVAWLVAKLYAFAPVPHAPGVSFATAFSRSASWNERPDARFDSILRASLDQIEPLLQHALLEIGRAGRGCDWAALTDDLSAWEIAETRQKWADQYLNR